MKIEIDIQEGYQLELENYWHRDFPEDDWSIFILGKTKEEVIDKAPEEIFPMNLESPLIQVHGLRLYKCKWINYNDNLIFLEKNVCPEKEANDIWKAITDSPKYEECKHQRELAIEEAKEQERQKQIKEAKEYRRKEYEKLKIEFNKE